MTPDLELVQEEGQVRFVLDAEPWAAFLAALDAPPRRHPRLERLLHESTPFDPLERPNRQVLGPEDFTEADRRAIQATEPPPEASAFDSERIG